MRILVGWEDPAQAELISLYLNVDENVVIVTTTSEELLKQAGSGGPWDVILFSTNMPDSATSFELFDQLKKAQRDSPVVGACRQEEVYRVARFMTNGMRNYVLRDDSGDFVFMLQAMLESTVISVRAEREQKLAELMREEIESVRKLQESIIPKNMYCPEGYRLCARYEPSQLQVMGGRSVVLAGGDYYDVFSLDDQSIVVLVGDASGHGMKACMSIMTMHTLVQMIRTAEYTDTASFVAEVNQRLCGQNIVQDEGGFITLFYGVLRADSHEFQWTSAGHPVPIIQQKKNNRTGGIGSEDLVGLPLGIVPDAEYETDTFKVPGDSRMLLYTDGLAEAFPNADDRHNEFGKEGIEKTLQQNRESGLEEALNALFDESEAFTQGAGRHDDTSAVMLERL